MSDQAIPRHDGNAMFFAARSLMADREMADLAAGLRTGGVDALFFKGRITERFLHDPGDPRPFGDLDVLVDPRQYALAERVLQRRGYANRYDGEAPQDAVEHAFSWRSDRWIFPVDLHLRLWGFGTAPADAWRVLWARREALSVGGEPVLVPDEASQLLLVALHAAHHEDAERPLADLRRAIDVVGTEGWRRATSVAAELEAVPALTTALGLLPEGAELLRALQLDVADGSMARPQSALWGAPTATEGLLRLKAQRGARAKARLLRKEAFPSSAFMRTQSAEAALARRGRSGLARSYAVRIGRLAVATLRRRRRTS